MEINWFTLVAQIINFLILILLLKRFLYRPILQAMENRERSIANRLQEATKKTQEAQQEAENYHRKQQEWEAQRETLLAQFNSEVEVWKKAQFQRAREEVDRDRAKWQQVLQQQQQSFFRHLQQDACRQVSLTVRRILTDLANASLEQQILETFLDYLQNLNPEERQAFCAAVNSNGHAEIDRPESQITVQSAFDLSEVSREKIDRVVQKYLISPIRLQFQTVPDLTCGIELRAKGCKLAWSMENYLNTLEESLIKLFAEEMKDGESS